MVTRSFRQLGVVIVLLVTYLSPAMACMVSDVQMNDAERACCQAMHNRCEQMGMPASHGCCQKIPHSDRDNALASQAFTDHSIAVAAVGLTASEWIHPTYIPAGWAEQADYSLPQSPPSFISVLRI